MASIKVAVRVRPFNEREKALASKCIIQMEGNKTAIETPQKKQFKEFVYDASFWSFDRLHGDYKSQEDIFNCLGVEAVENTFQGFNTCICAYGQTGSGKSHTMMGSETSHGLIPRICQAIIERAQASKDSISSRIDVNYLELYNEKIRDLLAGGSKKSLKLHETLQKRVYVDGLSEHRVKSYEEIEKLLKTGNSNRMTSATAMNESSSRSHAIFTLTFVQIKNKNGTLSETVSKLSLVDLAGSENAKSTGIRNGVQLLESRNINTSLFTLMTVISKLAQSMKRTDARSSSQHIPYRNSKLTHLLKDSLGGNSKTIFISTISPADLNYNETLNTLLYADRAKNIVNRPMVNEDPNAKLIRDLRAEIAYLKGMLDKTKSPEVSATSRELVSRAHLNTDVNGNSLEYHLVGRDDHDESDRHRDEILLRVVKYQQEAEERTNQVYLLTKELMLKDQEIEKLKQLQVVLVDNRTTTINNYQMVDAKSSSLGEFLRLELLTNYSTTIIYLTVKTCGYLLSKLQRRFSDEVRLVVGPIVSLILRKLNLKS